MPLLLLSVVHLPSLGLHTDVGFPHGHMLSHFMLPEKSRRRPFVTHSHITKSLTQCTLSLQGQKKTGDGWERFLKYEKYVSDCQSQNYIFW